jgi:hypothetical protein
VDSKWQNLCALAPAWDPLSRSLQEPSAWQTGEYFSVFAAIGILNVGWFLLVVPQARGVIDCQTLGAICTLLALGVAGLAVWVVLMFMPGSSIIHQGSYATMLLLLGGLAMLVAHLPRGLALALWIAQTVIFAATWVFYKRFESSLCPEAIAMGILSFLCILGLLAWFGRSVRVEAAMPIKPEGSARTSEPARGT